LLAEADVNASRDVAASGPAAGRVRPTLRPRAEDAPGS
jgi:hypothetical protein